MPARTRTPVPRPFPRDAAAAPLGDATTHALTLPAEAAGQRFDAVLARALPQYSRSRLKSWIDRERVTLDGKRADPTRRVKGGERVVVRPEAHPREVAFEPQKIALSIVDEDDALIVIDKPAGLVVHPGSGNWEGTLLNALLHH